MRRIIYAVLSVFMVTLSSCGDSSPSVPRNEHLGNVPKIMAEYNHADSLLDEEGEEFGESLKSEKDLPKAEKFMKEYKAKKEAIENKRDKALAKAKVSLIGKEIPVENRCSKFEVSGLKITDIDTGGDIIIEGKMVVIEDLPKSLAGTFAVEYSAVDNNGNVITNIGNDINSPDSDKDTTVKSGTEIPVRVVLSPSNNAGFGRFAKIIYSEK